MLRNWQRGWISILLGAAGAWVVLLGILSGANAAPPQTTGQPRIADPYHHLSGVVLYPPARMPAGRAAPGGGAAALARWAAPLVLPVFGPNVSASLGNGQAQNETTDAINPEDNLRVIASANDYRCNLCPYVYLSTDGGSTWTNYAIPASGLLYGDPAMTFGTGGYAYFGYLGYTGLCTGVGGMYVSHSTDAGASFSAPYQLAANNPGGLYAVFQDKDYVAVDNMPGSPYSGNVYEGWTHFVFQNGMNCGSAASQVDGSTVLARSTDHGLTWSVPITVSPVFSNNNQGTVPAIGRHGEVYVYYLGAQTQSQLNYDTVLFSRSTDGGQTFSYFTHIASIVDLPSPLPHTSFRDNAFGAMAVDQQLDGYLYAVWSDYRTGDADILFSRSTDNGTTWGAPQRVNDDPVGNGKDQFFPWITTSPDGLIHIGWFDRREDSGDANYKEYYTDSLDHGASFEPNVAVSSAVSVPGASGFIGDYSGIAASSGVVIPVWTDIRSGGNQDAYVARGVYTPPPSPTATPVPPTDTPVPPTATPTPGCTVGGWQQQASYPGAPENAATAAQDGLLYRFGGGSMTGSTAAYRYDPASNAWTSLAPLPEARRSSSAVSDGTYLYILNGEGGGAGYQNTLWRYDPLANSYTTLASAPISTTMQAAVYLNGKIYRIGGIVPGICCGTNTVDVYTIGSNTWAPAGTVASWPPSAYAPGAVAANGYVYVAGGEGDIGGTTDATYRYNPSTNTWDYAAVTDLPQSLSFFGTAVLDGRWIIAGGRSNLVNSANVIALDLSNPTGPWEPLTSLPTPRYTLGGATGSAGFYVVGGSNLGAGLPDTLLYGQVPCPTITPTSTPVVPTATPLVTQTGISEGTPTRVPSSTPTPCTIGFSDVHPTDYFYQPVTYLACHGVISGYADGTFRPFANTTRAQMVKIVVLGFQKPILTPSGGAYTFHDVPPSQPFFAVIETAAADDIVSGYTCGGPGEPCDTQQRPYFRPNASVTRGQLSKIDVVAAGWALQNPATGSFADVAPGSAFYKFVETAYCHNIISGYACGGVGEPCDPQNRPYFRQTANAIRGQISKIVYLSITAGTTCGGISPGS